MKNLGKNISLLTASSLSLIISLVLFIKSAVEGSYEGGFEANENYIIAFAASLILVLYFAYKLVCGLKGEEENYGTTAALAVTALVSFYNLGIFFKAMFKAASKKAQFDFASNQAYLFIGLVVLAVLVYYIFKFIEERKSQNN